MSTPLTEQERDSLTECECGHYANEHSSDGCLATDYHEDWEPVGDDDKCSCAHSPTAINRHAIESIVAARVAAAVSAEREQWRGKVAELHAPFNIYDECDHDHTDQDVREGKAVDIHEVGYTCALSYVSCRECCTDYDGLHYWPTEACADHHKHTLNPDDRCATVALLAAEREGARSDG